MRPFQTFIYGTVWLCLSLFGCAPGELKSTSGMADIERGPEDKPSGPMTPTHEEVPTVEEPSRDDGPNDETPDPVVHVEPDPPETNEGPPADALPGDDDIEPMVIDETEETPSVESCDFGYPVVSAAMQMRAEPNSIAADAQRSRQTSRIDYLEPLPPYTWEAFPDIRQTRRPAYDVRGLTMPGYQDEMPRFERAGPWTEPRRCYETPDGAQLLSQPEAFDLWVRIVRETLWFDVDTTPGRRTVVGLRGAYPGTFRWNGNTPNWFDDTLVLLWIDEDGDKHVREFPVNTDTGAHNFGYHSSSSLMPNRYYPYTNAWHRSYNALRMGLSSYPVRDDSNKNGHWDSDRNGWLNGGDADHDRLGSGHNIHMGSVEGRLSELRINRWSAGCQVIPGTANWNEFILNAWTFLGDEVDYYLIDARDIAESTWRPCDQENGSYECPIRIDAYPFVAQGDTATSQVSEHDVYNCSDANEAGHEVVYVLNVRRSGRLQVAITTNSEEIDPDIHLLTGNDANACLARGHRNIDHRVTPGRYLVVVDTWVNGDGVALSGAYELTVDLLE